MKQYAMLFPRALARAMRATSLMTGVEDGSWFLALFGPTGRFSAIVVFAALAAQQGGVLLTGLIAFALLGPQEYGRTASALAFLNIFIGPGSVSSSVVIYRLVLLYADNTTVQYYIIRFMRIAVTCSAITVLVVVLAALNIFPEVNYLKTNIILDIVSCLAFLFLSIVTSYQQGLVLAKGNLLPILIINLIILSLSVPMTWVLIEYYGYSGYFMSLAFPLAIRGSILLFREPMRRDVPEAVSRRQFDWRKALFGFMLPGTCAGFTTLPAYWAATEFLFRTPGGAAALGLIAVGISIKQAPMLFATSLISSLGRPVFRSFEDDKPKAVSLHRDMFKCAIAPVIAVACAISLAAGLTTLIVHPTSHMGNVTIVIAGLGAVLALEILYAFVYMPINMAGIMWQSLFFIALPKDVGLVLISLPLIKMLGWPGFLVALIVWNTFSVIFTVAVSRRNTDLAPFYTFGRGSKGLVGNSDGR